MAREIFDEKTGAGIEWASYIGYPQAAEILSGLLGVEVPVSRSQTILENGDCALVMRLMYRVDHAEKKGRKHGTRIEDYEFYFVRFSTYPLEETQ
jgi:hypothetical protein